MNALIKSSIGLVLLTLTAIAVYLYLAPGDKSFDAARSEPQDAICKQDGERLARLRARPSLDEGLRFVGEIRCMQLWPQLQTLLDGLSDPSRSTASSKLDRAASDTTSGSDAALSPGATSATLDDACKHDEDRLAELRANPSVDAAIRFDSELKCPRLKPQLPEILTQLSHAAGSVELGNRKAPASDTMSASAAAPPASEPPASEAMAAASEDGCKQDEERLAALQAKPSLNEAVRFEDELKCSKLQPQLLALLDSLSQALQSAGAQSRNGAPSNTTSASEAVPPTSEPPASEATSDACKHDEERLAELQAKPSVDEAVRFVGELTCSKLQPQLLALLNSLSQPAQSAGAPGSNGALPKTVAGEAAPPAAEPPASGVTTSRSDDACKRDEDRLAKLQANPTFDKAIRLASELTCIKLAPQLLAILEGLSHASETAPPSGPTGGSGTTSAGEAAPPSSESPATDAKSTTPDDACKQDEERLARLRQAPSSEEAARFAQELRCGTLRPQLLALTGEVVAPSPPNSESVSKDAAAATNTANAAPTALDTSAASKATVDAEHRIAQLESEKEALAAKVSRLERAQEESSAYETNSTPSPQPATPAERSENQPESQAAMDAERRIAQLESEKKALTAEVSRLQREREASSAEQASSTLSPQPASPAERSETQPTSQAAADAERRIAQLQSEKEALTAEVSRLPP